MTRPSAWRSADDTKRGRPVDDTRAKRKGTASAGPSSGAASQGNQTPLPRLLRRQRGGGARMRCPRLSVMALPFRPFSVAAQAHAFRGSPTKTHREIGPRSPKRKTERETNNMRTAAARIVPPPPPSDESKHDRFRRLSAPRINRALKSISLVGNLAGPGYEYTDEEREAVLGELEKAVDRLRLRFTRDLTPFSWPS